MKGSRIRLSCGHIVSFDDDPSGPIEEKPDGTEPSYCPTCGQPAAIQPLDPEHGCAKAGAVWKVSGIYVTECMCGYQAIGDTTAAALDDMRTHQSAA